MKLEFEHDYSDPLLKLLCLLRNKCNDMTSNISLDLLNTMIAAQ